MVAWDAIVAGAGPAGAAAAKALTRAGCRVLMIDPAVAAREKIGEALPGVAVRLLRALDFPTPDGTDRHQRIRGNLSAWGSPRLDATDFIRDPNGPGWRLDRVAFDAGLREGAMAAGAGFRATRIERLERSRNWCVHFADGTKTTARWLIDATGRAASLASRVGAKRRYDARLVALYAFGARRPGVEFDRTLVEAVPNGWWYSAWLPSGAPVAAWHLDPAEARRVRSVPGAWKRALRRTRHISELLSRATFEDVRASDAGGAILNPFAGDGWIACGDAALSFDPIAGHGLWAALYTGRAAGEAIVAARHHEPAAIEKYCKQLAEIRRHYVANQLKVYRAETRWSAKPFWAGRQFLAT